MADELEGSGRGLIQVRSYHFPGGTEKKPRNPRVRIVDVPVEIRTKHHQSTNERYNYAKSSVVYLQFCIILIVYFLAII
jgi:hypothetical protein